MEDGNTLCVSAHMFCQRRKLRSQAPLSRETLDTMEREPRKGLFLPRSAILESFTHGGYSGRRVWHQRRVV